MSPRSQILKLKLAATLGLNPSFDADCDGLLCSPAFEYLSGEATIYRLAQRCFHQSKRGLDQVLDVLAPSDFFPCRSLFDHAADFRPNIELNLDVPVAGRPRPCPDFRFMTLGKDLASEAKLSPPKNR